MIATSISFLPTYMQHPRQIYCRLQNISLYVQKSITYNHPPKLLNFTAQSLGCTVENLTVNTDLILRLPGPETQ